MTSSFVSVGGARVAYRMQGTGPAVVLVNGTGGGDGHWSDLIERLARSRAVVKILACFGNGMMPINGGPYRRAPATVASVTVILKPINMR
jgi:hypothetical protein